MALPLFLSVEAVSPGLETKQGQDVVVRGCFRRTSYGSILQAVGAQSHCHLRLRQPWNYKYIVPTNPEGYSLCTVSSILQFNDKLIT